MLTPPTILTIVDPNVGRTGIRGVTVFPFQAGDGSPGQTYAWEFGDGSNATGASVQHTYQTEGTFTVVLTASGSATTTASVQVKVGSLAGVWVRDAVQGVRARLEVVQTGQTLTGSYWILFDPGSPFGQLQDSSMSALEGSVDTNNNVQLRQTGECLRAVTNGTVNGDLTIMGGTGQYGNAACGDTTAGKSEWRFRRPTVQGPVF